MSECVCCVASGWEERRDPNTGRTFYIDHINKRTTWDDPRHAAPSAASGVGVPSAPAAPRPSGGRSQLDSDAELARQLATQWRTEDKAPAPRASTAGTTDEHGMSKEKDWASDETATHCFLTESKFTMVQRKHHCRYCGQIFIGDVCKKTAKIPTLGFVEAVRVCDTCFDQLERGDPVCLTKQVSLMRKESESARQQGLKTLANWASMDPQFAYASVAAAIEKLKVPERLAELLQAGTAPTQAAASQLLAQMFSHERHRELLERASLLAPLLGVLRKGADSETRTSAMRAVAALSAAEAGRDELRSIGGLATLLDVVLSGPSDELQEATCQVLANLCEDQTDDWRQLLRSGAVFSLLSSLPSSNLALQQVVLELLAMLSFHNECREQIADGGCMPALAVLLGSSKPDIQRAALALSQQLCVSRRACDAMLEAGVASPIAAMLLTSSSGGTEALVAVLECLRALASIGLTQAQTAVRNVGAVPYLIQLMNHEQRSIREMASSLVASVCPGDMHNAEQLFQSGGLVMLAEQIVSRDQRAQLQAVSALSQLSADPQQAAAIVENGCLAPLLDLLEHPNQELKAYAAITFGNLCASDAVPQAQLQHPSVLPHLVSMLTSTNGLAKAPAVAAIASMTGQPHLRQTVFQLGGLPGLAALLQADPDTAYHAVQAVAQYAADERYRQMLPEVGVMGPLAALLASNLEHVQKCAISAIANTSFVPSAVAPLVASGALAHIGQLLFSQEEAVQKMCLTTLCNLLQGDPSSADALLQSGGHMALITHLSTPLPETQSQAAMAIGHMSRNKTAVSALLQADAVPLLVQLLHAPDVSVQLQAVYALGGLAAEDEEAASALQRAGAIAPLTTLLLASNAPEVKHQMALTLANAVRGDWRLVFNVGGFQALLDVLAVGTDPIQQDVSGSLAVLLEDVHQRRALLADMDSVSAIVGLLSSSNVQTQHNASAAMAALAVEPPAREVLYRLGTLSHIIRSLAATNSREGQPASFDAARISMLKVVAAFAGDARYCNMLRITIQPLVAMLANPNGTVLQYAAEALRSLSRSESNRDALRDAGALRRMAELLLQTDEAVQHSAVQCVADLGVGASDAADFVASGWHLSLISLLSAPSVHVQGAAAAVLGSLCTAPEFRATLVKDGALEPMLNLLSSSSASTKTAAVRALGVISQQLVSSALPRDDPSSAHFVDAFFDAGGLKLLSDELRRDAPTDGATEAFEQGVGAILVLIESLSGGHGQVRGRLIDGGVIAALLRIVNGSAHAPEALEAAASALANLMLHADGCAQLESAGGVAVLSALMRSPTCATHAPLSRALAYLARDSQAAGLADEALPALLHVLSRGKAADTLDAIWGLANFFSLHHESFAAPMLLQLATTIAQMLSKKTLDADALQAVFAFLGQLVLRQASRDALRAAGVDAALLQLQADTGASHTLEMLLGFLTAGVAQQGSLGAQGNAAQGNAAQLPPVPHYQPTAQAAPVASASNPPPEYPVSVAAAPPTTAPPPTAPTPTAPPPTAPPPTAPPPTAPPPTAPPPTAPPPTAPPPTAPPPTAPPPTGSPPTAPPALESLAPPMFPSPPQYESQSLEEPEMPKAPQVGLQPQAQAEA